MACFLLIPHPSAHQSLCKLSHAGKNLYFKANTICGMPRFNLKFASAKNHFSTQSALSLEQKVKQHLRRLEPHLMLWKLWGRDLSLLLAFLYATALKAWVASLAFVNHRPRAWIQRIEMCGSLLSQAHTVQWLLYTYGKSCVRVHFYVWMHLCKSLTTGLLPLRNLKLNCKNL